MAEMWTLEDAWVDESVFALRPDYRVLLIAVDGLLPGPSDEESDALLRLAEAAASEWKADELAHVVAWR